jgi:replicative DNA helicase
LTLDRAEQRIFNLRDRTKRAQLRHIRHALAENYERLTRRMEHPSELTGLPSGFKEIDQFTEGFNSGELVVIAARPAVGKTSLALAIAYNVARTMSAALVFSLEMDTKQIVARFLGLTGQTNLLTLRTGGDILNTEAATHLRDLQIFVDDTPGLSIMELRTKARRVASAQPLGAIIVDYLQLMRTDEHEENRVQEISTITRNLKSLARELNTVVIALSQLSRAAGDAGTEPRLSTLRESGSIEQDADVVVMLWNDKADLPTGAPRLVHGSIAKNRNGPTGPFQLYFESERARFFSAADQEGVPM